MHENIPNALKARLTSSKKMQDEQRCILANCSGLIRSSFFNEVDIPIVGTKANDIVQNIFGQKIFNKEEALGSHIIQKFGATHVGQCGCSKDEKDIRGQWKGKGRVSDVYDDNELPHSHAKVAETLCFGGACI